MRSSFASSLLVAAFVLPFAARTVNAQQAAAGLPDPQQVGQEILDNAGGLTVFGSDPSQGFQTNDPAKLKAIVDSVSALNLVAQFKTNQNTPTTKVGAISVSGGATIDLQAHFVKKAGQPAAVLDSLELDSKGVGAGPGGAVKVKKVTLDSKGELSIKLDSWLPALTVKRIEPQSNGDVKIVGPWYLPNVTIKKDGTIHALGHDWGKVDSNFTDLLKNWPPTLETFLALGGLGKLNNTGSDDMTKQLSQLAGTMSWKLDGTMQNNAVAVGGKVVDGALDFSVKGDGRSQNGTVSTIGNNNTATIKVHMAPQTIGNADTGLDVKKAAIQLDGNYRLTAPLQDLDKHVAIDFNGKASYAFEGDNLHVTLPNGGKVSVGSVDMSRDAKFNFHENDDAKQLSMGDDGSYVAHIKGPIHVQNLGPVSSLDLNGTLTSTGTNQLTNGKLSLQGNVVGEEVVMNNGMAQLLNGEKGFYFKSTVNQGSKVDVNLNDLHATVGIQLAPNPNVKDLKPVLNSVGAQGNITAHADLSNVDAGANGARVQMPQASADVNIGIANNPNGGPLPQATVDATVKTGAPGTIDANLPGMPAIHATLDPDTSVHANVTATPGANGGVALSGKLDGELGAGNLTANEPGVINAKVNGDAKVGFNAPFAANVSPDGKVAIDPTKTSATVPVNISLNKGTQVTLNMNGSPTSVTMDKDGSTVQVTGNFAVDKDGKPVLKELDDANVDIKLGPVSATIAGKTISSPADKEVQLKGKVVFRPDGSGFDVYGSLNVGISGDDKTPILSVNYGAGSSPAVSLGAPIKLPTAGSSSSTGAAPAGPFQFKNGDQGPLVQSLQNALIANKYPLPKFGADSKYGSETAGQLAQIKKDHPTDWQALLTKAIAGH